MLKVENLVVGAGFSGAVIAERLASVLGEKVLVIEKKDHIAGNSYDFYDQNGICVHKYGSHIFHTNNEKVWEYVNNFTKFNSYQHKVIAVIDGKEIWIPFNFGSLYNVFDSNFAQKLEKKLLGKFAKNTKVPILEFQNQDDEDLKFLANYVYEKVFLNYTTKQWGVKPEEINSSVTARVPVFMGYDNRYFQDKYQGIPLKGYSALVEKILKNPKIKVKLNTDFSKIKDIEYKRLFFTGSIDEFFGYKYGILPYRSVFFELKEHNCEFYQKNSVINYPNDYDFTRIHEYKHYLGDKSQKTVIAKEFSEAFEIDKNERYYPIPKEENAELYQKYLNDAKKYENIYFLGRLGDYKYYDMDKAIARALEVFERLN